MKPIRCILSALVLAATPAAMGQQVERLGATDISIGRADNGGLSVSMTVNPRHCHLGRSQLIKVTPVIYSADSAFREELPSYCIGGTNQYYYTIRSNSEEAPVYRSGSKASGPYSVVLPWQEWMSRSTVALEVRATTCCDAPAGEEEVPVADIDLVPPTVVYDLGYVAPEVTGSKEFALEGRAYVNFPVNKTEIYPDYMNNPAELRKITSSIDTVRGNPDATITSITLTGYASPEGPYLNNVRLAKGRTESLRDYVSRLYDFPRSVYITNSVPEDWAGLRESIEKSDFALRDQMVSFIDSDYPIEKRNDRFRELFPLDYPWLLKNVYPWLRHTDYLIKYSIRRYTDVDEIREVLATRPQNLSLDEIYLLASTYPAGSDDYNEVFEVAVRMYPDDPVANLNAANTAIRRGDYAQAERYLAKAGDSADADYARGMLHAHSGDYDRALDYLGKCDTDKAREAMGEIEKVRNFKGTITFRNAE